MSIQAHHLSRLRGYKIFPFLPHSYEILLQNSEIKSPNYFIEVIKSNYIFLFFFRNHVENGPSHAGHGNSVTGTLRDKLNPPPPDLWIGHDQLELKDLSDEASALSAICDETGETTLTRSIMSNEPDYRATMERTRNYIQNSQYSGKLII